jgi:hypothetical protein
MQKLTQRLVDDVQALPDFFLLPSAFCLPLGSDPAAGL